MWSEMLSFIWTIRDEDLRHVYERHQVGDVILPLVVLRRLDSVLAPTKAKVLTKAKMLPGSPDDEYDLLCRVSGQSFYNTSKFDLPTLVTQDPDHVEENLNDYIQGFSPNIRQIITRFGFKNEIERMAEAKLLLRVLGKFAGPKLDLSPSNMTNLDMGYLYEECLRLASDLSNKEAGDHFTPREVIALMVNLLVSDTPDVHTAGKVFTVLDPACGTGGMLTEAEHRLLTINPKARVYLFGQEVNPKSFAVCTSDMLIKDQDASNIVLEDTLAHDGFPDRRFDYVIANPPYGVDWNGSMKAVVKEHARGEAGRFPGGLPGKGDGQMLFLQHMVAKAKTADEGGGRVAVVLNGSPLFSGDAGGGESNIRKWLFENDLVEAIIGLPDQMFYNTGINTYVWVLATKKRPERQGLVQLIDARELFVKMPKSLGNKRNEMTHEQIERVTALFESFVETERSKIMKNQAFGYTKVTVERPLRLRYEVTREAVTKLGADKNLAKLETPARDAILAAMEADIGWARRIGAEALSRAAAWVDKAGRTPKSVQDALLSAISVRDPKASSAVSSKGELIPDTGLRDWENIPLTEDVSAFLAREVLPYAPDAWPDRSVDRVGYEVPFTRLFYRYVAPRALEEIDADIKASRERFLDLLGEVAG